MHWGHVKILKCHSHSAGLFYFYITLYSLTIDYENDKKVNQTSTMTMTMTNDVTKDIQNQSLSKRCQ